MALKSYNPVTPSQRQLVLVDRSGLHRGAPMKTLTKGKSSSGGRNNNGRITVRFRGGGHKQAYRKVDFKRRKFDVPAKVERIEYDPNRTGFIALIKYDDGELAYILAPQRLSPGDVIVSGEHVDVKPGNAMPLASIPIGTIGAVSNPDNMNISIGKAGRKRWMGRMPHNRGVTMNPIDHPHGGGEGRTSGGRHPVTPWGFPTKGKKTRRNKSTTKFIIASRHARKK